MSAPLQPPMLHYLIYSGLGCGRLDVVLDHRIDVSEKMPKWIEAREYHPNVEKYYWSTRLRPMWIRTKKINLIKFVEYIEPPRNEGFKP